MPRHRLLKRLTYKKDRESSSKKSYNPKTATVDIDSTVRWINKDSTLHTVTSGKPKSDNTGEIFDSQYIASGDSFEFTFDKAGTYDDQLNIASVYEG